MSGSTENLLYNSQFSTSKESLDGQYHEIQPRQTKRENQGKTKGVENKGFHDEHSELEPSSSNEIYSPHEPQSYQKRANSLQQRPMAAPPKEPPRRHSSPDHNVHLSQERSRPRHGGGRRRLSSNVEEDLRRKACLNSMKRHQSANPLPVSGNEEYSYCYSTPQDKEMQSYNEDREKIQHPNEDRGSERSSRNQRDPPPRLGSSQQNNEVQNMQETIIALEKNQLEQYKKRLTLALSERAKLTGELQMLSQSLTQRGMESNRHSSESTSLGLSLCSSPSSARSPRLSHSLGDLRVPEMYGDYGDISVDYENSLRLPSLPGSAQSIASRKKMEIPELDLGSLNSSVERISSSDHVENHPKEKEFEKDKDTTQRLEGGKDSKHRNHEEKEDLKRMVDDIWGDNMRGDVLTEERSEVKDNHLEDENSRDSDLNNNEKTSKKLLTVEEFLTNEDSKKQPSEKEKIQKQKELHVLLGYEDMNGGESRGSSPGLYEPVECLFRAQSVQANDTERQEKTSVNHGEGLLRLKVNDEKTRKVGNPEDYFTASSLPVDKEKNKKEDDKNKINLKAARDEPNLNENQLPRVSRIGRNERRFNYMVPPGARANAATNSDNENDYLGRKDTEKEVERVPSNISDKLRYYRERLSNRAEEESSCDLADAYAREKDSEKKREIQRQAAYEAAILRREASALLFEAMNLERICDPNGRVRHVYLPH